MQVARLEDADLSPEEVQRMAVVYQADWNVSSLSAISNILYHLSGNFKKTTIHIFS